MHTSSPIVSVNIPTTDVCGEGPVCGGGAGSAFPGLSGCTLTIHAYLSAIDGQTCV